MKSRVLAQIRRTRLVAVSLFALMLFAAGASAQVVDKTVATVRDGLRTELITLSDLKWQLALQPSASVEKPASEELNRALQTMINQRLFALEAERLPRPAPTEKEIADKIADILSVFPSTAEFERRLKAVGFDSVKD